MRESSFVIERGAAGLVKKLKVAWAVPLNRELRQVA
jgi:hypothetical protein